MSEEKTPRSDWAVGYKELKNYIHNDMGISSEHIQEMFREIAREEITKAVGENGRFIVQTMRDIVRAEMVTAIQAEGYPIVTGNLHYHHKDNRNPFHQYVSQIMKEEIVSTLRNQFEVGIQINGKTPETTDTGSI